MSLGVLVLLAIGFVMWFQGNRAPEAPAGTESVSSTEPVATTRTSSTYPAVSTGSVPSAQKPAVKPKNPVEACIQAELDAGQTDANEIFKKCLPSAATP